MQSVTIHTPKKDVVIDITDHIQELITKTKFQEGICSVFVLHTTCCITTADLDPGTDLDLLDALRTLIPKLKYRHPHDPNHVPDHILSSILGQDITIPVDKGELVLGIWQRIILIELDGPRDRKLLVNCISTTA